MLEERGIFADGVRLEGSYFSLLIVGARGCPPLLVVHLTSSAVAPLLHVPATDDVASLLANQRGLCELLV